MYSNNKTVMFILQRSYTGILIPHYIGLLKQAGVHDYGKRPDRSRQMHPLLRSRSRPRARYSACGASSPYGKATHDDLSVASLLRYGCHQLTTIYASLRSFKLCSLVQLIFAATPEGETSHLAAAQTLDLNFFTSNLNSAFLRTSNGYPRSSPISCGRCRCCSFLRPRRTGRHRRGGW